MRLRGVAVRAFGVGVGVGAGHDRRRADLPGRRRARAPRLSPCRRSGSRDGRRISSNSIRSSISSQNSVALASPRSVGEAVADAEVGADAGLGLEIGVAGTGVELVVRRRAEAGAERAADRGVRRRQPGGGHAAGGIAAELGMLVEARGTVDHQRVVGVDVDCTKAPAIQFDVDGRGRRLAKSVRSLVGVVGAPLQRDGLGWRVGAKILDAGAIALGVEGRVAEAADPPSRCGRCRSS